ncbi:tryptophan--tRNA ligase, mitochondrial-like [Pomacea canaliculata]|uniref:tryptophan--tRNA ligase, mitochondrial-like n=1 Tax=Pomacea canaliculata TaxID=400727 RepID=UPI000D731B9A|nr:tryptophan--tRNA ligase, mitochondrial-like [Pomacea canaliculata]
MAASMNTLAMGTSRILLPVFGRFHRIIKLNKRHFCDVGDEKDAKTKQFAEVPPRLFSGIQPTGIPHIGNYIGAIKNWVMLQKKYDSVIFCIVDLHSITVPQEPKVLRQNILDMTACLLACGIDPEKSILFLQSHVQEHAELAWLLGCLCTLPRLQHLPQWKEKSQKIKEPGLGLFTYPVLQAADILLYKATDVPVGEDQIHHIELTRYLAKSFNRNFNTIFPRCRALTGESPKIRSLRNPEGKMSKSDPNPLSRIELTDSPKDITEKIKKAVTDFTSEVSYDPDRRPGVSNLIDIHMGVTELCAEEICENAFLNALTTAMYKATVAEAVIEHLKPISDSIQRLKNDPGHLEKVLKTGQERAQAIAQDTIMEVKQAMGLR